MGDPYRCGRQFDVRTSSIVVGRWCDCHGVQRYFEDEDEARLERPLRRALGKLRQRTDKDHRCRRVGPDISV